MHLKTYQQETLDTLRRFLETCRLGRPGPGLSGRHRGTGTAQAPGGLWGLPNVPYVCLRLPTGGGKTILGAHAVAVARDAWIEKDFPLVLWLVPSNTIRLQTVEALKDPRHSYRQALDDAFNGRVRVFDIAEFTRIRPNDIRDHLCLVVGRPSRPCGFPIPKGARSMPTMKTWSPISAAYPPPPPVWNGRKADRIRAGSNTPSPISCIFTAL